MDVFRLFEEYERQYWFSLKIFITYCCFEYVMIVTDCMVDVNLTTKWSCPWRSLFSGTVRTLFWIKFVHEYDCLPWLTNTEEPCRAQGFKKTHISYKLMIFFSLTYRSILIKKTRFWSRNMNSNSIFRFLR